MKIKLTYIISILLLIGISSCTNISPKTTESYAVNPLNESSIIEGLGSEAYTLSDEYIHVMDSKILDKSDNISISLWLNSNSNFNWTTILSMGNDSDNFFHLSSSGNPDGTLSGVNFSINSGSGIERVLSDPKFIIEVGVFNHIVITLDKKNLSIYLNGVMIGNENLSSSIKDLGCDELLVGRSNVFTDPKVNGAFQDLSIYNYALTEEEISEMFNDKFPMAVLSSIDFGDTSDILKDIHLPKNTKLDISWISSDETIINNSGQVNVPSDLSDNIEVFLDAKIQYKNQDYSRRFSFWILADSDSTNIKRSKTYLNNEMDYFINDNDILPSQIQEYDTNVNWKLLSGDAEIINGKIIKNSDESKIPIVLKAEISSGELKEEIDFKCLLLDEYVAYIMSYFNGQYEQETGKLAYSYDGLNWVSINKAGSIITSDLGTKRVRDPYINRDKNGNFIVLATQGWDNPEIYFWRSDDLITFYDHKLIRITLSDHYINLTGQRAWAPEVYYDYEHDYYTILFSDPRGEKLNDGSMYYVTTKDFQSVSYVSRIIKVNYPIIDATFLVIDGDYWSFYKDNFAGTIFTASSKELYNTVWTVYDEEFIFEKRYIEGPFVIEKNDSYLLYVDNYKKQKFYVAEFDQLGKQSNLKWLDESLYVLPESDVRHASVIEITQTELDNILEAYGN